MTDQEQKQLPPAFDVDKLDGVDKAAILLLSLSEEDVAAIFGDFSDDDAHAAVDVAPKPEPELSKGGWASSDDEVGAVKSGWLSSDEEAAEDKPMQDDP